MKATYTLLRWELRRIFSNWRQTVSVFIVPAVVLLVALYIFPVLLNLLSSGSVGRGKIILVDPDPSFIEFSENHPSSALINYDIVGGSEFKRLFESGDAENIMRRGGIFVTFSAFPYEGSSDNPGFSDTIRDYYDRLVRGDTERGSTAFMCIYYDRMNLSSNSNFIQFAEEIYMPYQDFVVRELGGEYYDSGGGGTFDINRVNPYTTLMSHRSRANPASSRVIPGILILLAYYCVYSLSADTLATERQRGFLAKLALTPIGTPSLLFGKASAVILVASVSSIVTLLVLIASSWVNFNDSALSLLPFGLMLFPKELLIVVISLLSVSALMTAFCFAVSMTMRDMKDVMINLQLPLVLFLGEFFAHLFRYTGVYLAEYFIPAHNVLVLIRDVLSGDFRLYRFAVVIVVNFALTLFMFLYTLKNFSPITAGISEKGGAND
ncbi:MAG: ABC transporter permease [Clostridiaceae bacterium]|nr:ABC transporter permease [Oscillospiraceae bacterium]NLO63605.1 ABC transporter permease [Clostridiaceae bacterium]